MIERRMEYCLLVVLEYRRQQHSTKAPSNSQEEGEQIITQ